MHWHRCDGGSGSGVRVAGQVAHCASELPTAEGAREQAAAGSTPSAPLLVRVASALFGLPHTAPRTSRLSKWFFMHLMATYLPFLMHWALSTSLKVPSPFLATKRYSAREEWMRAHAPQAPGGGWVGNAR